MYRLQMARRKVKLSFSMVGQTMLLCFFLCLFSCASRVTGSAGFVLADDVTFISNSTSNRDLLSAAWKGREFFLIGETHFVAEHQSFWADRFPALADAGYRVFAQEGQAAFSWLAEAYSLGETLAVDPESLLADAAEISGFDGYWLPVLRTYNLRQPETERLAFAYFDMNHWPYSFLKSLTLLLRAAGMPVEERPEWARQMLSLKPDTSAYRIALESALRLGEHSGLGLGPAWDGRLGRMLRDELASSQLRTRWNDNAREDFIERKVLELRQHYGGVPMVVNCGLNHAQLRTLMGPTRQVLGERLVRRLALDGYPSGALYSLAVVTLSGESLRRYDQALPERHSARSRGRPGELVFELAVLAQEQAGASALFLPLNLPRWRNNAYRMDYSGDFKIVRPGLQYSALLALPVASINPFLDVFRN